MTITKNPNHKPDTVSSFAWRLTMHRQRGDKIQHDATQAIQSKLIEFITEEEQNEAAQYGRS